MESITLLGLRLSKRLIGRSYRGRPHGVISRVLNMLQSRHAINRLRLSPGDHSCPRHWSPGCTRAAVPGYGWCQDGVQGGTGVVQYGYSMGPVWHRLDSVSTVPYSLLSPCMGPVRDCLKINVKSWSETVSRARTSS